MLATPTLFRVPTVEYAMSVIKTTNLLAQYGIALDSAFVGGDAFISKARNGLIQSFIESWKSPFPADVIVFVDDDEAWDEQAFLRIVMDPHEFIAVAIPKKMDTVEGQPQTYNNVMLDTDGHGNCIVEGGLLRISQIGSGFIALKRTAIEKLMKAYPRQYDPGDGGIHKLHYSFFESKIEWGEDPTKIGQFWGEDLIFCKKWKALGEHIWLDPNVTVEHVGRKSWTGNFMQFLQKHASVQLTQPQQAIPETLTEIERLAA
jgi:hypothetical protein